MTLQVSDFIPGSLEDTDKHIAVENEHHVASNQKGQPQIKMCDDNRNPFIAVLYNVRLDPDLCGRLFSIITLINSGHNFLFHKGFSIVYFGDKEKNTVTLPHSVQQEHTFLGEIKSKSKK